MLQAKKIWKFVTEPNAKEVDQLALEMPVTKNRHFLKLLVSRNIKSLAQAKAFMVPSLDELHDPFRMKDMDKAVERLSRALEDGEKILIYGDYDVDGTTSVALVFGYLTEELGAEADYYIPDRYAEGYGVSQAGVQYAADNNYSLIISLDCGIKAHERVRWCNEQGIDFIVCDHHLPEETLPEAYAVLDPKRADCAYPFKELTGCGVGFKLLQAFIQANDLDLGPLLDRLDLLAASIAADMVPITGENRILAYFGLQKLGNNPSPGVGYLLQKANKKAPIQISDIVFSISPIINAAGRMDHAHGAVKLLLSADLTEASAMAEAVIQQNIERRAVEKDITQHALSMFADNPFLQSAKSTVLFHPSWHKGVVGIVASKIQDHYFRPTIILTESHGQVVGSARSVKGFDIHAALEKCVDLLTQFGGHTHAAGLHLLPENLEAFIERFETLVQAGTPKGEIKAELPVDLKIPLEDLNLSFYDNLLVRLSPYGPGNMLPNFVSFVKLTRPPVIMKEEHLKIYVGDYEAVGFGMRKDFYEGLVDAHQQGQAIQIVYHLDINEFMGQRKLQLRLLDVGL
ncbi:single-stranded-DNA-specific exonuclease RecJ [Aquirufa sp.]|jgi:single-stranded-DNA-specific exonuclease|uniref:single-stranded-DNA-specific exonuclease RecJ n=1 Tax=Aquirufa sp. TaxID=2676249 RepID=UPI0037C19094